MKQPLINDERGAPPRLGRPAASADDRRLRIASLEQAVIDCLATRAAPDISVDDIARSAGMSRRTFYRFFASRSELFAQVLHGRAVRIAADVARFTSTLDDFSDAIVDGTMETLRLVSADPVFRALADANTMIEIMHLDEDGQHEGLFMATWKTVFARGRASGRLRPEISDWQAAEWLHSVHYLLTLRNDLSDGAKRAMLVSFVVPSLVIP